MMTETVATPVPGFGLDMTKPPWGEWHADMLKLVKGTLFKDKDGHAPTDSELYFCLMRAESLGLNPLAREIWFICGKDGGWEAYTGREGMVKKATERNAYFLSDDVRESDHFEVEHTDDGDTKVRHSYGHHKDRGKVVGAWAKLIFRDGSKPGFFYADLERYRPTFSAVEKTAWGEKNQLPAMIQKCAIVACARSRLNLAGVLIDAELPRVQEQWDLESSAVDVTAPVGNGQAPDVELPPDVEKLITRAAELGHHAYADRTAVSMIVGLRDEEFVANWLASASASLDTMELRKRTQELRKRTQEQPPEAVPQEDLEEVER